MNKLKLRSVSVPWKLSSSHEFIEYTGIEDEARITLLSHYSPQIREKILNDLGTQYGSQDNIPDELWNKAGYSVIEIKFTPIYLFSLNTPHQDYGVLDVERYDFSGVAQNDDWDETNYCPDPGFYEVVNSDLKMKLGSTSDKVHHWIVLGHNVYFDILAMSFNWMELD